MSTLNITTFPSPQRIALSSVYSRNIKHRNGPSLLPFPCEDFEPKMWSEKLIPSDCVQSRSQWPRGLRRRSAAARLLGLWVRIPPGKWMYVCCECCVLSGRGLCVGLITRPEESYRLRCVVVCDLENFMNEEPYPINVIELNIGDTSVDVFPVCH